MAVTILTDVLIHIYSTGVPNGIGSNSPYTEVPHPGSGKKIEGWKWDQRTWPDEKEFKAVAFAPSLWDPEVSGIRPDLYRSGYGDNKDLLLLDLDRFTFNTVNKWVPKINHGFFYSHDQEWYLYSDCHLTEYFTTANVTTSGLQYLDLSHELQPTIPIQIRRYRFDNFTGQHIVDLDFRKRLAFSASGVRPEFIIDFDVGNTPRLILDDDYSEEVGIETTGITGATDPAQIAQLEVLGLSDATNNQQFQTQTSPLDLGGDIEVWSWVDPSAATEWTQISGFDTFTPGDNFEVLIDHDRGTVSFGNYDPSTTEGAGHVPATGHRIGIRYTKGLAAFYEPKYSCDYILAPNADTNPVNNATNLGFVQVNTSPLDPYSITLIADLPQINPFLIELGNNVGELIATVKTRSGETIEGQEVTFEILPPITGSFGARSTDITAITNADGEANTFYNAPNTIGGIGGATDSVLYNGGDTVITVEGIVEPGSVSGLFLYKIHEEDLILGFPVSGVDDYYTDYLIEEDMVSGVQATQSYEETYRTINQLPKPNTYTPEELSKGKKTIILTQKPSGVINPHTGKYSTTTYSPIFPSSITNIGTATSPVLELVYTGVLLDIPGVNDTKAYFVVGESQTNIRAFTINERTNKRIKSNTIQMRVTLPDSVNGLFVCDLLSDVPSGLLNRVNNVEELTDDQILATSGIQELSDAYGDEKLILQHAIIPDHILSYRFGKSTAGGNDVDLNVELRKNTGATTIASFNHFNIASGVNHAAHFLTNSEINLITDYNDLSIAFSADDGAGGTPRTAFISWAELAIGGSPSGLAQQLRPDADIAVASWTTAPLFDKIDESTPSESDFITSSSADTDYAIVSLTSGIDPRSTSKYEDYNDWFRRTRNGDTVVLTLASLNPPVGIGDSGLAGLQPIVAEDCPGEIPLGWRLRSTGVTIAAALDQVTFLDPNDHLPSGYFELKSKASTLGQDFEVTI